MNMLIVVASKHGSTTEIGDFIGAELRKAGHTVDIFDARQAPSPAAYDAVVIGSSVYAGSWLGEARQYVDMHQELLGRMPVWLFSSGPLGAEEPQPEGDPAQLPELIYKTRARGHEIFVGKLDRDQLNWGEKLLVRLVNAPYGDFRNWDAIRHWAHTIQAEMMTLR